MWTRKNTFTVIARRRRCSSSIYLYGEQCKRFLAHIDEPDTNRKFSASDIYTQKCSKDYRKADQDCFCATSTQRVPWHVVPADDKKNARLIVFQIVLDALSGLQMIYPQDHCKAACRIERNQEDVGEMTPEGRRSETREDPGLKIPPSCCL